MRWNKRIRSRFAIAGESQHLKIQIQVAPVKVEWLLLVECSAGASFFCPAFNISAYGRTQLTLVRLD